MKPKDNWVNEVLDRAVRTTEAWPEWMRRPEFQTVPAPTTKAGNSDNGNLMQLGPDQGHSDKRD
jgi:hypothetical protein